MTIQQGDRVLIIPGTRFYRENTEYNPADVKGTVQDVVTSDVTTYYRVAWDHGITNSYEASDLMLAVPPTPIILNMGEL
jgi:hypothetical protein